MALSARRRCAIALSLTAALAATSLTVSAAPAAAAITVDHVTYWNQVLRATYKQVGGAPGPLARAGAIMHLAVYDAANSALCAQREADCLGQPYLLKVAAGGDFDTAIDYAAYHALEALYPTLDFDDELATAQAGIPGSPAQTAGMSTGQQTAAAVIADRANDGSNTTVPYPDGTVAGAWRSTTTPPTGAATPHWGNIEPFTMTSGSQFRPALPGDPASYAALLASPAYLEQFNEVKALGAANSTSRTADQTQAAFFWANDADGTYKPPGQLFHHTEIVADQEGLSTPSKVKLFAQVALALADAAILAWDAKFNTAIDLWRPISAVRLAGTDNNPNTTPDPGWTPLGATPQFPAWVSGHATFAYTWAEVMRHWFGTDNIGFTGGTDDPDAAGVQRSFDTFTAAADENAHSRLWLGVHFHFDADDTLDRSTQLGNHAAHTHLGANHSDEELLYVARTDATSRADCDNLGRQLGNEHRWEQYRCEWLVRYTSFRLWVR
jgi:hypothetical protein